MRRFVAGFILLFLIAPFALAQPKGEVESIGFGSSFYRPNCFVPMLIRLQADKSGTYQIQVFQEDLDRDNQIFTQTVSLTGADEGKGSDQRFWMYFIPQPTNGGLPDTTRGGNLRDIQQELKVFLYDEKGSKQLAQLPITQTVTNFDNVNVGRTQQSYVRGNRFVLAISDSSALPVWRDFQQTTGLSEDVAFVTVRSTELPEDVRGFEMVDAIVWLEAPLPDPAKPSDEKRFHAIQDWVRAGGHLVICQPPQRDATNSFAEMLPVDVKEVAPRPDLEPLKTFATEKAIKLEDQQKTNEKNQQAQFNTLDETPTDRRHRYEDWTLPTGPFMYARAALKPGAVADEKMLKWPDGSESPYIARISYGLGCVTWVAHDLSDPAITTKAKSGWPYVWDHVLDYKDDPIVVDSQTTDETKAPYEGGNGVDLGAPLLGPMELKSKSAMLVSIAVVFFIGYWVIAGPGLYVYLLTRSRQQLSWFLFALSAVVATLLTVIVVKLVVRGPPELSHITVVRGTAGSPQISLSRFGLYIPRDGDQEITLPEVEPRNVSYLTAYPKHPKHAIADNEFPAQRDYYIPIHDASEDGPVSITVPWRSTEKEMQARRVGTTGGTIDGSAKLRESDGIWTTEGLLTNGSGQRLRDVYMIFNRPDRADDWVLYQPFWEKDQTIDLKDFNDTKMKRMGFTGDAGGTPNDHVRLYGPVGIAGVNVNEGWAYYWYHSLGSDNGMVAQEHAAGNLEQSLIMMSIFNRLPPERNESVTDRKSAHLDVLRRGGRYLDLSNSVTAGKLVVIATADDDGKGPLPFPLTVDGAKVAGSGTVLYQFALPMDRIFESAATKATTGPTSNPTTTATTQPAAHVTVGS